MFLSHLNLNRASSSGKNISEAAYATGHPIMRFHLPVGEAPSRLYHISLSTMRPLVSSIGEASVLARFRNFPPSQGDLVVESISFRGWFSVLLILLSLPPSCSIPFSIPPISLNLILSTNHLVHLIPSSDYLIISPGH